MVATYNGVLPYGGSFGSMTQTVNQAGTATALISSANPSTVGASVTFTATVSQLVGAVVPTGSVNFAIDGGLPTSVPLDAAGVATLSTSTLAVGPHTVTADYPGNAAFLPSSATPLTQTVIQVVSTTLLVSSLNPSAPSDLVTFTATVTPPGPRAPSNSSTTARASAWSLLSAGTASFSTAALTTGTHPITAVYSGDTNNAGSTSARSSRS